jgi:amidohydrolase
LIAQSAGASADVSIQIGLPVTVNDPDLTEFMVPTIRRVAGENKAQLIPPVTGSEDFSFYAEQVPGLFVTLGVTPAGADLDTVPVNHSPFFYADEAALLTGVRLLASLAVDYMYANER